MAGSNSSKYGQRPSRIFPEFLTSRRTAHLLNHVRRRSDGSVKSHTIRRQIACDFRTSSFGRCSFGKNATSRKSELLKRTLVEQAREKLDDRSWSMKVMGTFFQGPKPFVKSRRLLALARVVFKKHGFLCDFRTSGFKGISYYWNIKKLRRYLRSLRRYL